jgi:hypothetical protein
MSKAYFAYETALLPNWKSFLTEPQAPASYKEDLKKAEYVQTAWNKLGAAGKSNVLTGVLGAVKYQLVGSNTTIEVKKGQALTAAQQNNSRCFVLKPSVFLRLAVAEVIAVQGSLPQGLQWAIKSETTGKPILWEEAAAGGQDQLLLQNTIGASGVYPLFIDPVRAILGTSSYDEEDLPGIAARFGLPSPVNLDSKLLFTRGLAKLLGEA